MRVEWKVGWLVEQMVVLMVVMMVEMGNLMVGSKAVLLDEY